MGGSGGDPRSGFFCKHRQSRIAAMAQKTKVPMMQPAMIPAFNLLLDDDNLDEPCVDPSSAVVDVVVTAGVS